MRLPVLVALVYFSISAFSQDSIPDKKRLNLIRYGGLATYTLGMVGLNELWYSQTPRESFHFFNDAAQWKQVDKLGHFYSAFHVSHTLYKAWRWAGVKEKRSTITSSLIGFGVLSSIEIFDGFTSGYGASVTDLAANATGSILCWGQITAWHELRIYPKFSFSPTSFASQNPDLLGNNFVEEILKDYNGQTYWLSVDMDKFMNFPKWLNLSIGYGANGMVNARDNQNINPYRQYYIGIDFDLTSIHTKSKILNGLIFFVNMIKLPAPTIEFSAKGTRAHVLFF